MTLLGSSPAQPVRSMSVAASAAIGRMAKGGRHCMDVPMLRRGTWDRAQLRSGIVALQERQARDELAVGLAHQHHDLAQLAGERAFLGDGDALRLDRGDES